MASTGNSRPTMRPTSRAHSPAAFTTCSAMIVPLLVLTCQLPSAALRQGFDHDMRFICWRRFSARLLHRHASPHRGLHGLQSGHTWRRQTDSGSISGSQFMGPLRGDDFQIHPCPDICPWHETDFSQSNRSWVAASIIPPVICRPISWPGELFYFLI